MPWKRASLNLIRSIRDRMRFALRTIPRGQPIKLGVTEVDLPNLQKVVASIHNFLKCVDLQFPRVRACALSALRGRAMSLSKRILFGDDPANDEARARIHERILKRLELFTFKIPTRRRNRLGMGGYWDPIWPGSVQSAAGELKIDTVQINSHVCTRSQAEADAISARATEVYQERVKSSLKVASEIPGQLKSK
ncbi:hypothetical protein NLM33_38260 [Bradyrhizobium sp. CCGUVB1N3]|uniref:hypothetical protein n=1 Tax=Bradyrhizobium sp. CCGUVB1N3 TaxID=2949629 RepID=UPI0020B41491|nr:hypothetical protein [Bradyrhizobium sp. CCGUVB1N3]MCP3476078.1 hypothetical protein [Bradyrhizobium sp. CCGUVB1N3]